MEDWGRTGTLALLPTIPLLFLSMKGFDTEVFVSTQELVFSSTSLMTASPNGRSSPFKRRLGNAKILGIRPCGLIV